MKIAIYTDELSIEIKSDRFIFSCCKGMYSEGRDGTGLQVDEGEDEKRAEILCLAITKALKQYEVTK